MLLLLSPNERCAKSNDKAPKERSTAGTSDVKIPEPDKPLPAFLRFLSPDFPFLANMLLIVKRSDVFFYLRMPIKDKEMSLGALLRFDVPPTKSKVICLTLSFFGTQLSLNPKRNYSSNAHEGAA
jgi:hypothetical protein